MTTKQKAFKLLTFIHQKEIQGEGWQEGTMAEIIDADQARVDMCLEYLKGKGLIKGETTYGPFLYQKITHKGIDVAEGVVEEETGGTDITGIHIENLEISLDSIAKLDASLL